MVGVMPAGRRSTTSTATSALLVTVYSGDQAGRLWRVIGSNGRADTPSSASRATSRATGGVGVPSPRSSPGSPPLQPTRMLTATAAASMRHRTIAGTIPLVLAWWPSLRRFTARYDS